MYVPVVVRLFVVRAAGSSIAINILENLQRCGKFYGIPSRASIHTAETDNITRGRLSLFYMTRSRYDTTDKNCLPGTRLHYARLDYKITWCTELYSFSLELLDVLEYV